MVGAHPRRGAALVGEVGKPEEYHRPERELYAFCHLLPIRGRWSVIRARRR
jgi:hypothetical protein